MDLPTVTSTVPEVVSAGLSEGTLERIGGVIREVATGRILAFLRGLGDVGKLPHEVAGALDLGATLGILNLGIASMGFVVLDRRVKRIEKRVDEVQRTIALMNRKLDISFFANFLAALDLADHAMKMSDSANRKAMATLAVNGFAKAEHYYSRLLDHPGPNALSIDQYLNTLLLAHVAEARCYLELEERETARASLERAARQLMPRVDEQLRLLLTTNPAAFLHPRLRGKVDLPRLTRVLHWFDRSLDENAVFENQRENLYRLANDTSGWIKSLPPAVWDPQVHLQRSSKWPAILRPLSGYGSDVEASVFARLAQVIETIEGIVEDARRFQMFQLEVEAMERLELSFEEWLSLSPADASDEKGGLVFITPNEPLEVPIKAAIAV